MTSRHDYPELCDPPAAKPVEYAQVRCEVCVGLGHKVTHVTVSGVEQMSRCVWCGGRGYYWTEVQS